MSSRTDNASSTLLTATSGTRAPAPKCDRDAPPANAGWYAAPATTGRDVDLQPLSGAGDAPLASQSWYAAPATTGRDVDLQSPSGAGDASPATLGRYATAATTACDDEPTHRTVMMQALIEDRQH